MATLLQAFAEAKPEEIALVDDFGGKPTGRISIAALIN